MCGGGSVEGAARYISVRCCRGQLFKFVVANGAKKKTRRLFFLLFPSHLDFCPPGERVLSRPRPPTVITPLLTTEAIGDWAGQASCGRQMKLATPPFCADRTLLLLSKEKRPKSLTCRLHCAKCRQTRRNCRKAAATETLTHLDDWLIARLCDETPLITHTHTQHCFLGSYHFHFSIANPRYGNAIRTHPSFLFVRYISARSGCHRNLRRLVLLEFFEIFDFT